ncbi:hypothetical protein MLD38_039756 [Melastoma candidum]|uniref:Uncharacterized protein n=1 Tax=Melastoma candidum TaxID=119954 RepID=A0ACB9L3H0_9MYRT|nr:hypothetical protein MLD38_039756 [Melastoma candidum]
MRMEGSDNSGSSDSPVAKKLRTEKDEAEEEQPSASSASDVHNQPRKARSSGDDDGHKGEEEVSLFSRSFVPQRSQGKSQPVPVMSLQVAPEMQKGQPYSAELIKSSQALAPAETVTIELPAIQCEDQLHVAPNGAYNSEKMIMPSQLNLGSEVPLRPERNLLEDQSTHDYANVQNLNMQTQMGNGFAGRAQWAEWLHLHQQLAVHEPSTLLRLQDFQGHGYVLHDGVVTNNSPYATGAPAFVQHSCNTSQQGLGNYDILSSASPTFDPALAPATFTGMLGVRGPNLETNRLAEGGDSFGHSLMNGGYGDLVHTRLSPQVATRRSPQIASRPVSPAQAAPDRNRIPVPNSIYDPIYEALGLPVDPHLRLFLARQRGSGR